MVGMGHVRRPRSISGPIIYGSISVALTAALLVGWIYVIVKTQDLSAWRSELWLLVAGIVSFLAIITVLVLFSVFLARAILEVRRQTRFVDSVTHELRSPLASLRLCLETMDRPGIEEPQIQRLRDMMREDIERLSGFIDDILEVTRLEHGGRGHVISRVPLRDFVQRCANTVSRRHQGDEGTISINIPDRIAIETDPTALELILKNLLDNALKYSDQPAHITVQASEEDSGLRIEVVDQGIGIPRRSLARVFDRFYRVDQEAVRSRRGTGLGLYVVKALVTGLRGKISAQSDGPGTGTRIIVTLPSSHLAVVEKNLATGSVP